MRVHSIKRIVLLGETMNSDIYVPFTMVQCIKLHKIYCIWFKSLDCGYTWTLPATTLLTAQVTAAELIHKAATVTFNNPRTA